MCCYCNCCKFCCYSTEKTIWLLQPLSIYFFAIAVKQTFCYCSCCKIKKRKKMLLRLLRQVPAVDGESMRFIMAIIASEIQNKEGTIISISMHSKNAYPTKNVIYLLKYTICFRRANTISEKWFRLYVFPQKRL